MSVNKSKIYVLTRTGDILGPFCDIPCIFLPAAAVLTKFFFFKKKKCNIVVKELQEPVVCFFV